MKRKGSSNRGKSDKGDAGAVKRLKGKVNFFTSYRGFGFIECGNTEYFVHSSSILGANHLLIGDEVEFAERFTHKGPAAIEVKITSRDTEAEDRKEQEKWIIMKKNPFTPQDPIVDPERFAGRRSHVGNAIDALFNSKNILITGPRGIGKSSLGYQLMYLAGGDNRLAEKLDIDLDGADFSYATGDHRCSPGNTLSNISSALIATLCRCIGQDKSETKTTTKFELGLKYFKIGEEVNYEKVSSGDLAGMFALDVETLLESVKDKFVGATFLIDEIDTLEKQVELATFLKAVTERLRLQYHLKVNFILSGVTGSITDLVLQHPSASRLFENLHIDLMTEKELKQIIELSLADEGVTITDSAKEQICRLSNNFPQPVHLLGYHAFRLDSDAHIDDSDVEASKRHVVENVRSQEFQERFGKIINGGNRSVARAFAISKYETTGLSYLLKNCKGLDDSAVIRATEQLVEHDILEELEHHVWMFKDPLFRIYFRLGMGVDEDAAAKARSGNTKENSDRRYHNRRTKNNPRLGKKTSKRARKKSPKKKTQPRKANRRKDN